MIKDDSRVRFNRRRDRVRREIRAVAGNRPRLSIFRSNKHIEAQIIDDSVGKTIVCVSSLQKQFNGIKGSDCSAAEIVGKKLAELALQKGVKKVCFDRGGYAYHGRVKVLSEAARTAGVDF